MNSVKATILLVVTAALISCSTKPSDAPPVTASAMAEPITKDSIPFSVFMSFGEFEPYLKQSNDTTYVLNFWATWCKPCMEELPFFEKLIPAVAGKPVKVVLVSMDFPKDYQRKLLPFVLQRNLQKNVVALGDLDYDAWIEKVSGQWDGAIPFTLVYNKSGRAEKMGELASYDELLKLLGEL